MENLLEKNIEGKIGQQKYYCEIIWRNGKMIMDEPKVLSGQDLGPDPYTTLLASLAGCTLSTLRMYIDRKQWGIPEIFVSLNLAKDGETTHISREISFGNTIDEETKDRLLVIAEKCPVSKILKGEVIINTTYNGY